MRRTGNDEQGSKMRTRAAFRVNPDLDVEYAGTMTTGPAHFRRGGTCQKAFCAEVSWGSDNPRIIRGTLYLDGIETSITKLLWDKKPYPDNTWHYEEDCQEEKG